MTTLDVPPSGPNFDWRVFRDWLFKLWREIKGLTFGGGAFSYSAAISASASTGDTGTQVLTPGLDPTGYNAAISATMAPGDGSVSPLLLPLSTANQVVKTSHYSDAGSSTTSTVFVNMQGATFTYKPVSANSYLNLYFYLQGEEQNLAATNTTASFQAYETTSGNVALGSSYFIAAPSSSGGIGIQAQVTVVVSGLTNTGLTNRMFQLFAKSSSASASASASNIICIIEEVSNV